MTKGSVYTKGQLREQNLINSWDIGRSAGNRVFISYSNDTSRGGNGMRVQVVGLGFATDPAAPWYEHGCKTFYPRNIKEKSRAVLAAQAWASLQGYVAAYTEWERDPYSGWHPKGTMKKVLQAKIKEKA